MANLSDVIYKMIDNAHPVGSYYLTETDTNPSAILHVGTWVQLKDRMLIGCGDSFAISSEGGEITHTLTGNEMPSHNHGVPKQVFMANNAGVLEINDSNFDALLATDNAASSYGISCTDDQKNGIIGYSGNGQAHNNMPPYHTCYVWRRVS